MKILCCFLCSVLVVVSCGSLNVRGQELTEAEAAALDEQVNSVVRESGTLESAARVELRAPVSSTVTFLLPEGTHVEEGDLVASLDTGLLDESVAKQTVEIANGKSNLLAARSALESLRFALKAANEIGRRHVKVAQVKLESFKGKGGEYETEKLNLKDKVDAVKKQIVAADAVLKDASHDRGSETAVLVAEAELAMVKANLSVLLRQQQLLEITKRTRHEELESVVLDQRTKLNRETKTLQVEIERADAELVAAETRFESEKAKMDSLKSTLSRCELRATRSGVVQYPPGRRGVPSLEVGASVRERQSISFVADLNNFQVAATVNETKIGRVKVGQSAEVRVDALVDKVFEGKVVAVNKTPEPSSFLQQAGRQYRVTVSFGDPTPQLRAGMTAMVDIRVK